MGKRKIVHDIKNKLGAIKFASSILNNDKIPPHKKDIIINNLNDAVNEVIELFEIFSQVDKYKKASLNKEKTKILSLLRTLVKFEPSCEDKTLYFDKYWLKKAFENILTQVTNCEIKTLTKNGSLIIIFLFKPKQIYIDLAKEVFSTIGEIKEEDGKIEIIL